MDIIITDMIGHSFTIKLNWDICIMKQQISKYYEEKIKNEYLIKRNISKKEFYENRNISFRWYQSEDYTRISNYCEENITLIYRDKILEQYHVETDQITEDDLEENNNMNFVITKNDTINMEPRGDYDVDYDAYDYYDDNN